jgi:MFS family permease
MADPLNSKTQIGGVDVGDRRTRHALVASAWDGVFATVMLGIVETFGVAGAVALGVPAVAIGLLGPLPAWLGTLAQLVLRNPTVGRARKPWIVAAVRAQATMLLVLALTGWAPDRWAATLYVIAFILYGATNAAVSHLWMSWMSDLVPHAVLGRHMSWRAAIFACVQLGTTAVAGWFARGYSNATAPWLMYAVAFAMAGAARHVSARCLMLQFEPICAEPVAASERFAPSPALARFAKAIALLNGAALLSGPFFAVWFLRDLRFSYLEFALAGGCSLIGQLIANRFVGHLTDVMGAARVLRVGALLVTLVPVPYLFIESVWGVWLSNFASGVSWATVNLAAFKYLVQASGGGPHRSGFVYANLWLTSATLIMGLIGGLCAPHLPTLFRWPLQTLFFMSALVRVAVVVAYFTRLPDLEPPDAIRRWGPGRFFQIFRWSGPGSSQV